MIRAMRSAARMVLSHHELSDPLGEGPVGAFEEAIAGRLGARGALATGSGTAALDVALAIAVEGRKEAEVVVPVGLAPYLRDRVIRAGATPIACPIDPDRGTLQPRAVKAVANSRTTAILAVDSDGIPCPLEPLLAVAASVGALVIEDAAPALGGWDGVRPSGAGSHFTVVSLAWGKSLPGGEGGALITGSNHLWRQAQARRVPGFPRLHPVAAAMATAALPWIERWARRRERRIARLTKTIVPHLPSAIRPFHLPSGVRASGAGGLLFCYTPDAADPSAKRLAERASAARLDLVMRPLGEEVLLSIPFWDLASARTKDLPNLAAAASWVLAKPHLRP